jgi:hypothetical protein
VEFGHQVDIGFRGPLAARDGAEKGQVQNTGSPKFRLILAQLGADVLPVHARILPHLTIHLQYRNFSGAARGSRGCSKSSA